MSTRRSTRRACSAAAATGGGRRRSRRWEGATWLAPLQHVNEIVAVVLGACGIRVGASQRNVVRVEQRRCARTAGDDANPDTRRELLFKIEYDLARRDEVGFADVDHAPPVVLIESRDRGRLQAGTRAAQEG